MTNRVTPRQNPVNQALVTSDRASAPCDDRKTKTVTVPININGEFDFEVPEGLSHEDCMRLAKETIKKTLNEAAAKGRASKSGEARLTSFRGNAWSSGGAVDVGDLHFHVEHIPENNESVAIVSLTPEDEPGVIASERATLKVYVHPNRVFVMAPTPGGDDEQHVALINIKSGLLNTYVWDGLKDQPVFRVPIPGVVSDQH